MSWRGRPTISTMGSSRIRYFVVYRPSVPFWCGKQQQQQVQCGLQLQKGAKQRRGAFWNVVAEEGEDLCG